MAKVLEGLYRAKVLPFTFEKVGEKETPMMKAFFQPIGQVVDGNVVAEENLPKQNYGYFLTLDIQDKGKYAGKSGMEALKIQLEEIYGYTGPFNPDSINSTIPGKEVNLVCEKNEYNGKTYTKVKFVNNISGNGKPKKPVKHLDANELAAFGKVFEGSAPAAKPADAASLFAQLTGGKDGK